jgi:hypothetical protein
MFENEVLRKIFGPRKDVVQLRRLSFRSFISTLHVSSLRGVQLQGQLCLTFSAVTGTTKN